MIVSLRDERGSHLVEIGRPTGSKDPLSKIDSTVFPLLSSIDPYGNTIFNRIQMSRLPGEIQRLINSIMLSSDEVDFLNKITELCSQGSRKPHHYLWFLGD